MFYLLTTQFLLFCLLVLCVVVVIYALLNRAPSSNGEITETTSPQEPDEMEEPEPETISNSVFIVRMDDTPTDEELRQNVPEGAPGYIFNYHGFEFEDTYSSTFDVISVLMFVHEINEDEEELTARLNALSLDSEITVKARYKVPQDDGHVESTFRIRREMRFIAPPPPPLPPLYGSEQDRRNNRPLNFGKGTPGRR